MKSVTSIANEILSVCPNLTESDRARLKVEIEESLRVDRCEINDVIQSRLKIPQYAIAKLMQEIEELLLEVILLPQSDPSIKSDSLELG